MVQELSSRYPEAIIFVVNYPYYIYDRADSNTHTLRDLGRMRTNYLRQAYTSKDEKVFWVVNLDDRYDLDLRVDMSLIASDLKPVFSDPYENTLILESDFSAGCRLAREPDQEERSIGLDRRSPRSFSSNWLAELERFTSEGQPCRHS
jgi:hypothetical protein